MLRPLMLVALLGLPPALAAQEAEPEVAPESDKAPEPAMSLDRLDRIIRALAPDSQTNGAVWQFAIDGVPVIVVTDKSADRMRAMTPVVRSADITPAQMERMMQANFDSALDARYAIANEVLWSAYIHPLSPLQKDQLISGIGQVVNLAQSFGTLYSSGGLQYGGGDSGALQRDLIDELLEKGEEI